MEAKQEIYKCSKCYKGFNVNSNLTRHLKSHEEKHFQCSICIKAFTLKQNLDSHLKLHFYPTIPQFKIGEAKLKCSKEALHVAGCSKEAVDDVWMHPDKAETAAKRAGGSTLWRASIVVSFGKYAGKTFKWLLENDVGWVVWLLDAFSIHGEKCPSMLWQKERLLEFVKEFSSVMCHLDNRLKKRKEKKDAPTAAGDFDDDSITDAELLAMAEDVLQNSEVGVSTQITSVGKLLPPSVSTLASEDRPSTSSADRSLSSVDDSTMHEGWQKFWDEPSAQVQGMSPSNVRWLKTDGPYGIFQTAKMYTTSKGECGTRQTFKKKMEFNPPPLPTSVKGSLPSMLSFFTTPVFFWRPVGVMETKIKCPNPKCPAPPGSYLTKSGYGNIARQVCGMRHNYTLLTERLKCNPCMRLREQVKSEDDQPLQYRWHAFSPSILMQLCPAVRSMFPAIICGKRAIDKNVVTFLSDRLNSVSMTKVHRMIQQGHDEWYAERRDLYQTLLMEAHTASKTPTSQRGILSFTDHHYTPPIPPTPIPSPRVLRRAHLIMEMEKMPVYRSSIMSVTGNILCMDGTKQVLKKIQGDGKGTMHYVTSVLNEWGQFLTTVVVASESENCYRRLAQGLIARFKCANAAAPKVLYADNNCCRDSGTSWLESLFQDWSDDGMVIRLDIWHWLHRWDAVVIKQSHAKYGVFISALAGAVLAYNKHDMDQLIQAIRKGNKDFSQYSDKEMLSFVKPHQASAYVRRVTRGVQESAFAVEYILEEFKGPAGLDIDGIPLFKSPEAVNKHWATASKHLSCMQDPPNIQLYVATKVVTINGVKLNKYRCRRGSNSLEGLHAHLLNAIPSKRCGIIPFQVYLISFAVQWNNRMEKLKVVGGKGRLNSCVDPRQVQRLNQHAEILFGKDHLFEPNFSAPMVTPDNYGEPAEEELLGVEYAYCQSTDFSSKNYYIKEAEEEQSNVEEMESEDEGIEDEGTDTGTDADVSDIQVDPMDSISTKHAVVTKEEQITGEISPVLEDVLMKPSHLHLPGYDDVENLALLLLQLSNDGDHHLIPVNLRNKIAEAAGKLADHDKSARNFVKKYESKWGYTLFGRCLGSDSQETSAAQKTKFGWMRYAQAAEITEESRLLYILIKMLKNRPKVGGLSSPTKIAAMIKATYKRIVGRVRDDPVLSVVDIPLPNINAKSISAFFSRQDKRSNYLATAKPKVTTHRKVLSSQPMPAASKLPQSLPSPSYTQVQYKDVPHESGRRHGEKRRLEFDAKRKLEFDAPETPDLTELPPQSSAPTEPKFPRRICPKSTASPGSSGVPILLVVPSQPMAQSVSLQPASSSVPFIFQPPPPPPPKQTRSLPDQSTKPCAACHVPKCGGLRKRYTPSKAKTVGSNQKMFTFCPTTNKSTTPGFQQEVYDNYEHFKRMVDEELERRKSTGSQN